MLSRMSKKRAVEDDVVKVTDLPYKVRKLLEKSQKIKEKIEEKEENKRIKCLEDMQKALQQILVEGKSTYAVELDTGFGRKTLARWASLNSIESVTGNISQMVLNQRGRKAVVVDKIVEKVKSDTTLNDMLGKSAKNIMPVRASAKVTLPNYDPNEDTNTITSRVNSIVTDYVKETKPDAAPVSLSETTIRRILKKADTYTVKKGRSQNERRAEALGDPYNYISLAAMTIILYSQMSDIPITDMKQMSGAELLDDPRAVKNIDTRLMFNLDKSSS